MRAFNIGEARVLHRIRNRVDFFVRSRVKREHRFGRAMRGLFEEDDALRRNLADLAIVQNMIADRALMVHADGRHECVVKRRDLRDAMHAEVNVIEYRPVGR